MIHELFKLFQWMGSEWVLAILMMLSLVVGCVILNRWWEIKQLSAASRRFWQEQAEGWFQQGAIEGWDDPKQDLRAAYPCLESDTLDVLKKATARPNVDAAKVVDAYLEQRRIKLEKHVGILGTIGSNAPFVGLLGTVLGIIRAFHDMSSKGLGSGMESISGGISEALVATAIGLLVAVPAVVFFNLMNKRISELMRRAQSVSTLALSRKQ